MQKPIRIKKSALYHLKGTYRYNGVLFTGIMFEEEGDDINAHTVEQGEIKGKYTSEYILKAESYMQEHNLKPEQKPQKLYKGEPLNCVTYEFKGDYCVSERFYVNGVLVVTLQWYPSGQLKSYKWFVNNIGGEFAFYEGGKPFVTTIKKETSHLSLSFSSKHKLTRIYLFGDFFHEKNNLVDQLPFYVMKDPSELAAFDCDEQMMFYGDGITNELIESLLDRQKLKGTEQISITNVRLDKALINKFGGLAKLKRLGIQDSRGTLAEELCTLFNKRKTINISYRFILD